MVCGSVVILYIALLDNRTGILLCCLLTITDEYRVHESKWTSHVHESY